jgi:heptaprenyl diphosphate synthase
MDHKKLRQMMYIALMTTIAIILHYVEGLFPLPVAIPGIKLGLSNVVSLVALYLFGPAHAFAILVLRVLLTTFLYTGFSSMIFSLSGGILSVLAMSAIRGLSEKGFGIVGASVCGGIFHNIGQLASAAVVLRTASVFSYLPVLIGAGVVTGIGTGVLAGIIVPRLKKIMSVQEHI